MVRTQTKRYAARSRGAGGIPMVRGASDQAGQPAVGVLGAAVLDVEQPLADGPGDLAVVDPVAVVARATGPAQLTHGRDHRGGAAGEDLDDVAAGRAVLPLLDGDPPLLRLQAHLLRERQHRRARDAL